MITLIHSSIRCVQLVYSMAANTCEHAFRARQTDRQRETDGAYRSYSNRRATKMNCT